MIYGTTFAKNRYLRYKSLQWGYHSDYKSLQIKRAYDGPQPKACYKATYSDDQVTIVGESLDTVKAAITSYWNKRTSGEWARDVYTRYDDDGSPYNGGSA